MSDDNAPHNLQELLGTAPRRQRVIDDCVRLIDSEVASKRGLMAMPLKAGYKVVKNFKPGFISKSVDFLLDEFCQALQPFYERWAAQDPRPALDQALAGDQENVSEALLGVTDKKAEKSSNRVIVRTYRGLRGTAKNHVKAALPGLGRTLSPHLS